ncbi:MAG: hypothetical protein V9G23_18435 [Giesbergeria sp.]
MQTALWLAERYALDDDVLEEGDAEGVIRTALVLQALGYRGAEWPSVAAFRKLLTTRRAAGKALGTAAALPSPKGLPPALHAVVDAQKPVVLADLGKLLDPARPLGTLLRPMSALRNRYFLLEDPLGEVDEYLRAAEPLGEDEAPPAAASKTWQRATQGENDEAALLTLFLCLAVGVPKKTLLPEKAAKALVRKLRTKGWEPELAEAFIAEHAPEVHRSRLPGACGAALSARRVARCRMTTTMGWAMRWRCCGASATWGNDPTALLTQRRLKTQSHQACAAWSSGGLVA